jgi:hypothetical protein
MDVSGQLQAMATLLPKQELLVTLDRSVGEPLR